MPVVLITGGARGIGAACARAFAADHDVAFTWHRGAEAASALESDLPGCLSIQVDLSEPDAPESVVARVMERFGRIDVLVNNAAIVCETPWEQFDPEAHLAQYAVNSVAPAALMAAAARHMQRGAAIINIASVNAVHPPAGAGAYAGTKAALVALTKSAAKAFGGRGIRVNAVSPGAVERDYAPRPQDLIDRFVAETALDRVGTPEDIASAVRFLASEGAGFITGEVITVSGGFRL